MRGTSSRRGLAHKPGRPKQAPRSSAAHPQPKISGTFIRNNSEVPFILLWESRMRGTSSRRGLAHKPSRPKQAPRSSGTPISNHKSFRSWILKNSNPPTTLPKKSRASATRGPRSIRAPVPTPKRRVAQRTVVPTSTPQKHHYTEGVTQSLSFSLRESRMRGTSSRRGLAHKPSRPKQAPRSSGSPSPTQNLWHLHSEPFKAPFHSPSGSVKCEGRAVGEGSIAIFGNQLLKLKSQSLYRDLILLPLIASIRQSIERTIHC